MTEDTAKICERIRLLIERQKLSYAELEKETGVPKSAIHRYATGQTSKIPIDRVIKLAGALGSTAAWIMGWEEEKPPETDGKAKELLDIINQLSEQNLDRAIDYLSILLQTQ